jgi:hypothetical protein
MNMFRTVAVASTLALTLTACAQNPTSPADANHSAHHPPAAAAAATAAPPPADRMAKMGEHMKAMRDMHEKMSRANTPQERQALMGEHMKLMQEGMALMGGMWHGPRAGMPGMGGMQGMGQMGAPGMPMDPATRQQMMEMRMEMMQSMMQMMMDRTAPTPGKP